MIQIYMRDIRPDFEGGYDRITFHGALFLKDDPIDPREFSTKRYVDNWINQIDLDFFTTGQIRPAVFPAFMGDIRNKKGSNNFALITVVSKGKYAKLKHDTAGRVIGGEREFNPTPDEIEGIPFSKISFDKYKSIDPTMKEGEYSYKDFTADNVNASGYMKLKDPNDIKNPLGLEYPFTKDTVIISREKVEELISVEAALEYFKIKRDGYDGKDDWSKAFCSIVDHAGRPWALQRNTSVLALANTDKKNYTNVTSRIGLGSKRNVVVAGDHLLFVSVENGIVRLPMTEVRKNNFTVAILHTPPQTGLTGSEDLAMAMHNGFLYVVANNPKGAKTNAMILYIKMDEKTGLPTGKWLQGEALPSSNKRTDFKMVISPNGTIHTVDTLNGAVYRSDISTAGKPINTKALSVVFNIPNYNLAGSGSEVFQMGSYLYSIPGNHNEYNTDGSLKVEGLPQNIMYRALVRDGEIVNGWETVFLNTNLPFGTKSVVISARALYVYTASSTGTQVHFSPIDNNGNFDSFFLLDEAPISVKKTPEASPTIAVGSKMLVYASNGEVFTRAWGDGKDDYNYVTKPGYIPDGVCGGVEVITQIFASLNNVSGRPWQRQTDFSTKENRAVNAIIPKFIKTNRQNVTTLPYVYGEMLTCLKLSKDAGETVPVNGVSFDLGLDGGIKKQTVHNAKTFPPIEGVKHTDSAEVFVYNGVLYVIMKTFEGQNHANNFIYRAGLGPEGRITGGWVKTKQLPFSQDFSLTIEIRGSVLYLMDNASSKVYSTIFYDDGSLGDWKTISNPFKPETIHHLERGGATFSYDGYIYHFNGFNKERLEGVENPLVQVDTRVKSSYIRNVDDLGSFQPTTNGSSIPEGIKKVLTTNGNVYVINYITPEMAGLIPGIEIYNAAIRSDKQLSKLVKIAEYRSLGPEQWSKDIGVALAGNFMYICVHKGTVAMEWSQGKIDYVPEQATTFEEDKFYTNKIDWEFSKPHIGTTVPDDNAKPWQFQHSMEDISKVLPQSGYSGMNDILTKTTETGTVMVDHNFLYTVTMEEGKSIRIRRLELNPTTGLPIRMSPITGDTTPIDQKFVDGEFVVPYPVSSGRLNINNVLMYKDNLIVFYMHEEGLVGALTRKIFMVTYRFNKYGNITQSPIKSGALPLSDALHVGVILLKSNLYIINTLTGETSVQTLKDDGTVAKWGVSDDTISVKLGNDPFAGAEPFVIGHYAYLIPNTHWYRLVSEKNGVMSKTILATEDISKITLPNFYYRTAINNDRLLGPWEKLTIDGRFEITHKRFITSANFVNFVEENNKNGLVSYWDPSEDRKNFIVQSRSFDIDHDGRLFNYSNARPCINSVVNGRMTSMALSKDRVWIGANNLYYHAKVEQGKNVYTKAFEKLPTDLALTGSWDRPWLIDEYYEEGPEPLTEEEKKIQILTVSHPTSLKKETIPGTFFEYDKRFCYISGNKLQQVPVLPQKDGTGNLDFAKSVIATIVPLDPKEITTNGFKYSVMSHEGQSLLFAMQNGYHDAAKPVKTYKLPNSTQKELIEVSMLSPKDGKPFSCNVMRVFGNNVFFWKKGDKFISYFRVNYQTYQRSDISTIELPEEIGTTGPLEIYHYQQKLHIVGYDRKVYSVAFKNNAPTATAWKSVLGPVLAADLLTSKIYDIQVEGTKLSIIAATEGNEKHPVEGVSDQQVLIFGQYQQDKFKETRRSKHVVTWLKNASSPDTHFGKVNGCLFAKTSTDIFKVSQPELSTAYSDVPAREHIYSGKGKDFGYTTEMDLQATGGAPAKGVPLVYNGKLYVGNPKIGLFIYDDKLVYGKEQSANKSPLITYTDGLDVNLGQWLTIKLSTTRLLLVFIDKLGNGNTIITDLNLKAIGKWEKLVMGKPSNNIPNAVAMYAAGTILVLHGGAASEVYRTHVDPFTGKLGVPYKDTFTNTKNIDSNYGRGGVIVSMDNAIEFFTGGRLDGAKDTRLELTPKTMKSVRVKSNEHQIAENWTVRDLTNKANPGERSIIAFKDKFLLCSPNYISDLNSVVMTGTFVEYQRKIVDGIGTLEETGVKFNVRQPEGLDHRDPHFFTCNNGVYLIMSQKLFKVEQMDKPVDPVAPPKDGGKGGRPWALQFGTGSTGTIKNEFVKYMDIGIINNEKLDAAFSVAFVNFGRYIILNTRDKLGKSWKIDPYTGELSDPVPFKIQFDGSGGVGEIEIYRNKEGKRFLYLAISHGHVMFPMVNAEIPIVAKGTTYKIDNMMFTTDIMLSGNKLYMSMQKLPSGWMVYGEELIYYREINETNGTLGPLVLGSTPVGGRKSPTWSGAYWKTDNEVFTVPNQHDMVFQETMHSMGKDPFSFPITAVIGANIKEGNITGQWKNYGPPAIGQGVMPGFKHVVSTDKNAFVFSTGNDVTMTTYDIGNTGTTISNKGSITLKVPDIRSPAITKTHLYVLTKEGVYRQAYKGGDNDYFGEFPIYGRSNWTEGKPWNRQADFAKVTSKGLGDKASQFKDIDPNSAVKHFKHLFVHKGKLCVYSNQNTISTSYSLNSDGTINANSIGGNNGAILPSFMDNKDVRAPFLINQDHFFTLGSSWDGNVHVKIGKPNTAGFWGSWVQSLDLPYTMVNQVNMFSLANRIYFMSAKNGVVCFIDFDGKDPTNVKLTTMAKNMPVNKFAFGATEYILDKYLYWIPGHQEHLTNKNIAYDKNAKKNVYYRIGVRENELIGNWETLTNSYDFQDAQREAFTLHKRVYLISAIYHVLDQRIKNINLETINGSSKIIWTKPIEAGGYWKPNPDYKPGYWMDDPNDPLTDPNTPYIDKNSLTPFYGSIALSPISGYDPGGQNNASWGSAGCLWWDKNGANLGSVAALGYNNSAPEKAVIGSYGRSDPQFKGLHSAKLGTETVYVSLFNVNGVDEIRTCVGGYVSSCTLWTPSIAGNSNKYETGHRVVVFRKDYPKVYIGNGPRKPNQIWVPPVGEEQIWVVYPNEGHWEKNPNYKPGYYKPNPNNKPGYWKEDPNNPKDPDSTRPGYNEKLKTVDVTKLIALPLPVLRSAVEYHIDSWGRRLRYNTSYGSKTYSGEETECHVNENHGQPGSAGMQNQQLMSYSKKPVKLPEYDYGFRMYPVDINGHGKVFRVHNYGGDVYNIEVYSCSHATLSTTSFGKPTQRHSPHKLHDGSPEAWGHKPSNPEGGKIWVPEQKFPEVWVPPVGEEQIWIPPPPDLQPNLTLTTGASLNRLYISTGYHLLFMTLDGGLNNYDAYLKVGYRPDDV